MRFNFFITRLLELGLIDDLSLSQTLQMSLKYSSFYPFGFATNCLLNFSLTVF